MEHLDAYPVTSAHIWVWTDHDSVLRWRNWLSPDGQHHWFRSKYIPPKWPAFGWSDQHKLSETSQPARAPKKPASTIL